MLENASADDKCISCTATFHEDFLNVKTEPTAISAHEILHESNTFLRKIQVSPFSPTEGRLLETACGAAKEKGSAERGAEVSDTDLSILSDGLQQINLGTALGQLANRYHSDFGSVLLAQQYFQTLYPPMKCCN